MHHPKRTLRRAGTPLTAIVAALAITACGSSTSQNANALLRQTFSGVHRVNSGNLSLSLTLSPSGSRTIGSPITLSFGGPFESLGTGKLPASDFNVSLRALGSGGSVGILSTGTTGYVTFQGDSYQLPKADFQRLESSFSQLASSPGASSGSGLLGKLGIQPLHWLVNPQVVGTETVGGASTTHIHATINVPALLRDFNTFLERAASVGVSGSASFPRGISAASQSRIAREVQNPSFDVWTGNSDRTVRKLLIKVTLPVTGKVSTLLGGLRSAGIGLSVQYADLNEPQTINAPATVLPYSQFQAKLRTLEAELQSGVGSLSGGSGLSLGSSSSGSGAGSSSSGSGSSASGYQAYSNCIQAASGNVAKMQRCASLLTK